MIGAAVARRPASRWLTRWSRRGLRRQHLLLASLALVSIFVSSFQAVAQNAGHCLAASEQGGCVEGRVTDADGILLPGLHIFFTEPTDRYGHGVLGDAIEWGGLGYIRQGSAAHGPYEMDDLSLPKTHVFEDLTPRLADLDGDAIPEIIVVETDADRGAALAIYSIATGRIEKLTETPHIGTSHRWLAPLGAADLDGDGAMELAYIDRPHLAKTLRIWRFSNNLLTQVAAMKGVTNHRIGEDFISGGIRDCGDGPEIITADSRWRQVVATRFVNGELQPKVIGRFEGAKSLENALNCI